LRISATLRTEFGNACSVSWLLQNFAAHWPRRIPQRQVSGRRSIQVALRDHGGGLRSPVRKLRHAGRDVSHLVRCGRVSE